MEFSNYQTNGDSASRKILTTCSTSVFYSHVLLMPFSDSAVQKFQLFFHLVDSCVVFQVLSLILLGNKLKVFISFTYTLCNTVLCLTFEEVGFFFVAFKNICKSKRNIPPVQINAGLLFTLLIQFYMMFAFSLFSPSFHSHFLKSHRALY